MERSSSNSHQNHHTSSAVDNNDSDSNDNPPPRLLHVRSISNDTVKSVVLHAGDSLRLADVQRLFQGVSKLLLTNADKLTIREATDGIFKAPKEGWNPYDVYAVSDSAHISDAAVTSSCSSNSNSSVSEPVNVSDVISGLASLFKELQDSFRVSASGGCVMEKFVEYRANAIQVFTKLIMKLGPESFDMWTLFRISEDEPEICKALMFLVQEHRKCEICDVKFGDAVEALMHFASIKHGQICLAKFQEPQLLDVFLINARDMGFFYSLSDLPVSKSNEEHSDNTDDDDSEELVSSKESSETESKVSANLADDPQPSTATAPQLMMVPLEVTKSHYTTFMKPDDILASRFNAELRALKKRVPESGNTLNRELKNRFLKKSG